MTSKILVFDNNLMLSEKINTLLRNNGYVAAVASDYPEAKKLMKSTSFDLFIADCRPRQAEAVQLLDDIKKHDTVIKVVFTGSDTDMALAIELMHLGAAYFLIKPLNPEILLEKVRLIINKKNAPAPLASQKNPCVAKLPYSYIRGNSHCARLLYEEIRLVAPTDYNIIIQGETGTGKESVARLIHEQSAVAGKPFVPIDCGSLTKELAASELFGHEKGSFTGAQNDKTGAFQLADGGTLFLDEIGNLPYEVQIYLLRSIQEGVVRKVGGTKELPVDVRLVVATNEDLQKAVAEKKFREDLYHRLNEFKILLPPLRERKEDLMIFIESFIKEAAERLEKNITGIEADALTLLVNYPWPGNIRELKNVIKNACLRAVDGHKIDRNDFPVDIMNNNREAVLPVEEIFSTMAGTPVPDIKETVRGVEVLTILKVLESVKYNKSKAAEILKIDRKTLYNKLKGILPKT